MARTRALLISITASAALLAVPPAEAQVPTPIPTFSLVLVSDPGDFIGGGATHLLSNKNGSRMVRYGTGREEVELDFSGDGTGGEIRFAAAPGKKLKPGFYDHAQRTPFREQGHPGLSVSMGSRGCNVLYGWFDIKRISFRSDGTLRRLHMTFEQHCEGKRAALYGEVRVGRGSHAADASVLPDHPSFTDVDVGGSSWEVPIYVVPRRRGIEVRKVSKRGLNSPEFDIITNTCPGRTLRPGTGCGLVVRFGPSTGGPKSADVRLRINDTTKRVVMEAMAVPGRSQVTMQSDPGDYIGQGQSWFFSTLEGDIFYSWKSATEVDTRVETSQGTFWFLDFLAADGFVEGQTYDARRPGHTPGYPGMRISGEQRGCNELNGTFTVNDIGRRRYLAHYISVAFEQHCEGADAALRGTLDYRIPLGETDLPSPVENLTIRRENNRATIEWSPSPATDVAYYMVRYDIGRSAPRGPLHGYRAYAGVKRSVTIRRLPGGRPVSVSVFPVDNAGNIGLPVKAAAMRR